VPERVPISACIIAMDEEDRIAACIRSLDWCDEVLVVDSHSSDGTRAVAAELGARVIERDWPGHVAQKEFAVRAAAHDWVFCIDADEQVSGALRAEILALRERGFPDHAGWSAPRLSHHLGAWIRHGTWYPDRQLRLFDRRRGRWSGRDPHDKVELDGSCGSLAGELLHHPYRDLGEHLATIDRYTTTMAEGLVARGERVSLFDVIIRPPARFLGFYVTQLGCLDGWRGLVLASLAAHYCRMKYTKAYLLQGTQGPRQ
jgi:glycosyltransferase involved in cell wall biosynthesis